MTGDRDGLGPGSDAYFDRKFAADARGELARLRADKTTLLATNKALVEALESLREDCESKLALYERNGPQWTSPQGNEYESTSDVLACYVDLLETILPALPSKPQQE